MKDRNITFDKSFWKSSGWFLLIAALICCLPWLLAKHSWIDFSSTGEIGDTIGGIMGPFIAIAAAGLTFIAFWVQYKANILQRHDIAIERFESNLFEMIHIQQEITNGLRYDGGDYNHNEIHKSGRDVFQCLYELVAVRVTLDNTTRNLTLYRAFELSDETKYSMRSVSRDRFVTHESFIKTPSYHLLGNQKKEGKPDFKQNLFAYIEKVPEGQVSGINLN